MRLGLLALFLVTSGCAVGGEGGLAPVGPSGPLAVLERAVRTDGSTGPAAAQSVRVVRRGVPIRAHLGLTFEREDEIETDASTSVVLRFGGGTEIIVGPETRVKISSLKVFFGQIYVTVVGLFEIETEYVTAGVEGTEYWLRVARGDTVDIVVIEGRVRLASKSGRWPPVSIGRLQGATMVRDAPPRPRPVDPGEVNTIIRWVNGVKSATGRPPPLLVPKVIGLSLADARSALHAAQLRVGTTEERVTGRHPAGTVIESSPGPGTRVAPGSAVALIVEGVSSIRVPKVIGLAPDEARRVLANSKLSAGSESHRVTRQGKPGTVVQQDPAPDAQVSPGAAVDLVVESESIVVPKVEGLVLADAERQLRQARLNGRVTESRVSRARAGIVLQQIPPAGTQVAPGSTVDLVVSVAPGPSPPPRDPRGGAGTPR